MNPIFEEVSRPRNQYPSTTWDANHPDLASGKRVYKGMKIVGEVIAFDKRTQHDQVSGQDVEALIITLHTYLDPNNPTILQTAPDGDIVTYWSTNKIFNENLAFGKKGEGMQVGDILLIQNNGKKMNPKTKRQFWDIKPFIARRNPEFSAAGMVVKPVPAHTTIVAPVQAQVAPVQPQSGPTAPSASEDLPW